MSNRIHPRKFQESALRAALERDAQWVRFVTEIENARITPFKPGASEKILRPSERTDRESTSPYDPDAPFSICIGRRA